MEIDPAAVEARPHEVFPGLLGVRFVELTRDRVVAELTIRDELKTPGGRLHGGALMALADTVGATATVLNLPPNTWTTTLESKANFFAAGREGTVRAEADPDGPAVGGYAAMLIC